ncbi:hypothetical protein [Neomicrococcus lactis]|uniref:Exonuclease VII large subunit n=1 Tax=Neomicrococcus lactis TaxID=732241 RepID=A0A7W9DCA9_9MICC|nr:hypothetical protein [Neomicrococcus lactis]MBB5599344.1 exonuclease VII large subunit [Neomicrococcus lactis]
MSEDTKPARTLAGLNRTASKSGVGMLMKKNRTESPQEPTEAAEQASPVSLHMVDEPEKADQVTESATNRLTDSVTNKLTESVSNRVPKYLQLKRREARIYDNQADELTALTRRLNDQRKKSDGTTAGERITDNTLVRLAIDLLLERKQELSGATEEELARSLGLSYRHKTTTD